MPRSIELRRDLAVLLGGLLILLAWDSSGLDLALVRAFGTSTGFPWRDHWLTRGLLHEGGRALGYLLLIVLIFNVWRPLPFARGLTRRERATWLGSLLLCVAIIPLLKRESLTSCPWSLEEFSGTARYVSHWRWGVPDGGGGGCFPSGHASTAFCLLSGWFALRAAQPRAARVWLACTCVAGLVLGLGQTMRGAHYPSHTLWTAWICLAVCALCHHVASRAPEPVLAA